MAEELTFRRLLDPRKPELFWQISDVSDAFRPSVFFNEIISGYLTILEDSHENGQVHFCQIPLVDNMYFEHGDHRIIRFINGPVAANGEDFIRRRALDYTRLANLIELAHGNYFLPDIEVENSPELFDFLHDLRSSSGKELWLKEHYTLWDPDRRFDIFIDLQARCAQPDFESEFLFLLEHWEPVDFLQLYPGGFAEVIFDDDYLWEKISYKNRHQYKNQFSDLVHFARNVAAHYTENQRNLYTKAEVEWRLFKHYPFILKGVCDVLIEVGLYCLLG